jgi:hypothetical protein
MFLITLLIIAVLVIIPMRVIADDKANYDDDEDYEGLDDTQEDDDEGETEERDFDEPEKEVEDEIDEEPTPINGMADEKWMNKAIRDIAYYLRAHKFNDFDRRKHVNETTAPRVSIMTIVDPCPSVSV